MKFNQLLAIGGASFFILILIWIFCPIDADATPLHKDKFVRLACSPNPVEEDVDGYRIYWRSGLEDWSTNRSVKFYRWAKEGTPKLIWLKDKETGIINLEFQLTPEFATLMTNSQYQFYATTFKGEIESPPSPNRPYWVSPQLIPFCVNDAPTAN